MLSKRIPYKYHIYDNVDFKSDKLILYLKFKLSNRLYINTIFMHDVDFKSDL